MFEVKYGKFCANIYSNFKSTFWFKITKISVSFVSENLRPSSQRIECHMSRYENVYLIDKNMQVFFPNKGVDEKCSVNGAMVSELEHH